MAHGVVRRCKKRALRAACVPARARARRPGRRAPTPTTCQTRRHAPEMTSSPTHEDICPKKTTFFLLLSKKKNEQNQPSTSASAVPPPFLLDIVHGPAADTHVRAPPGTARLLLGRKKGPSTALHVPDDTVSEKHAEIVWEGRPASVGGGRFTITDLGSTNGTRLNGEEVVGNGPAHDLNEGDVLALGKGTVAIVSVRFDGGGEGGGEIWA